jgi:hypothetical protein
MKTHNDKTPNDEVREERDDPAFDFWSDEEARSFNDILGEGSAYTPTDAHVSEDFEAYFEDEQCDYRDPDLDNSDGETLPAGEMELIFENSYIM